MPDSRVERYAELLLDTCLGVQRGWQVIVWGTPWARPLLEEVMKGLAERGAYALLRLTFSGGSYSHAAWVRHAPLDALAEPASIDVHALENCDAWLGISAPENTHDRADISPERTSTVQRAYSKAMSRLNEMEVPWVLCWYPTPALAQDAHMTLPAFADFLYSSCLVDWRAEHERISRYARRFDRAEEVRIVADGTDPRLSVAERRADVDAGTGNMPGGEVYVCPVETSAEGTIAFTEFPGTSRSASGSTTSAARTSRRSTGTSSRTCAPADASSWTARSSRRTASGSRDELGVTRLPGRLRIAWRRSINLLSKSREEKRVDASLVEHVHEMTLADARARIAHDASLSLLVDPHHGARRARRGG